MLVCVVLFDLILFSLLVFVFMISSFLSLWYCCFKNFKKWKVVSKIKNWGYLIILYDPSLYETILLDVIRRMAGYMIYYRIDCIGRSRSHIMVDQVNLTVVLNVGTIEWSCKMISITLDDWPNQLVVGTIYCSCRTTPIVLYNWLNQLAVFLVSIGTNCIVLYDTLLCCMI